MEAIHRITKGITKMNAHLRKQLDGMAHDAAMRVLKIAREGASFAHAAPMDQADGMVRGIGYARIEKSTGLLTHIKKALATSPNASGGYLLPDEVSTDLIEAVRAASPWQALGATFSTMNTGNLSLPKITSGSEAQWGSENEVFDEADDHEPSFGSVQLHARKLIAFCQISNELLADSGQLAEQVVRDDLSRGIGEAMTAAILHGSGGIQPLGLRNWDGVKILDAVALSSLTAEDVAEAIGYVEDQNLQVSGLLLTPKLSRSLRLIKDALTGKYLWSDNLSEGEGATFLGVSVAKTTLATDPDESTTHYLVAGNWQDLVIATRGPIEVALSGDVAFRSDQSVVRARLRVDCAPRRIESFAVLPITGC